MTAPLFRTTRAERIALIACAILEAVLIFGVVVPTVLHRSHTTERPDDSAGASHD